MQTTGATTTASDKVRHALIAAKELRNCVVQLDDNQQATAEMLMAVDDIILYLQELSSRVMVG